MAEPTRRGHAFDPRVTAARTDLAAKHLEGKVQASRFVEGRTCEVVEPQAPVRRAPSPDAPLDTEALTGERVSVYEISQEGWAWVQLEDDGYVGFMPASALGPPGPPPTHKVAALRTLAFPGPSIKLAPTATLAFGCRIPIARIEEPFAVTTSGQYLPSTHLVSIETCESDFVAVAERFVGTPYLWGGKTNLGIDCSGLLQISLRSVGVACPRDSDMQEQAIGRSLALSEHGFQFKRGDLVFWPGHVAIARDSSTLVHANAFHMAVAIEPIDEAIARIRSAGSELRGLRRC